MGRRTKRRFVWCIATSSLLGAFVSAVVAEPQRAPGSGTGDGSTSFTGLAQAPEANLFVGASTTSIAIEVPPGRKNLTPKLALGYSSGGGPSPYGYGWDLPLGKIQHGTKHGVLPCSGSAYQNDYVLVLPGTTVECTLNTTDNRCYPPTEEAFLKIQYFPANDHWEIWDKSGLHYNLGDVQAARAPVYPDTGCSTFSWALTHIQDPNGNYLDVVYITDSSVSYPDYIRYGGNGLLQPLFEVNFVWSNEDAFSRPAGDQISNSSGGFQAKLTKLLSRIEVKYSSALVRWYSFKYEFQTATTTDDRIARQSFLSAVTLYDKNNQALARVDGLPVSTTFLYQQNDSASGRFAFGVVQNAPQLPIPTTTTSYGATFGLGRWSNTGGSWHGTTRDILDMNGDGIPDLVDTSACSATNPYWKVFLGTKAGFATTVTNWQVSTTPVLVCWIREVNVYSWGSVTVHDTVDINGDGIPDWVNAGQAPWQVYLGYAPTPSASGGFDAPRTWNSPALTAVHAGALAHFLGWDGTGDYLDLVDMNADGLPDLVYLPTTGEGSVPWTVWYNTGQCQRGGSAPCGFDSGSGTAVPARYDYLRFTTDNA